MNAVPGHVLAGRYRLGDQLGRGSMGTVWLASDGVLGREVAVKEVTYPPHLSDEERGLLRERTLREARAAARFAHPQVTTVHDVVEEDGKPWIVMEHVRSRTLIEAVRDEGPLPPGRVAQVGVDLLGALEAAHRAGIVHRDVKPANVLLDESGRAWLTDFGIATSSGESSLTTEGILVGSPSYMSPERARGEDPGPAADLWALGATLYTAAEGRPPFERGEPVATLVAVLLDDPEPFCAAGPLEPVLRGLLLKDPTQRMGMQEARAVLEAVADGTGPGRPSGALPPTGRSSDPGIPGRPGSDQPGSDQPGSDPPVRGAPNGRPGRSSAARPDLDSADRANRVERMHLADLSAIAKEAAKSETSAMAASTASVAARAAARVAARAAARRAGQRRLAPAHDNPRQAPAQDKPHPAPAPVEHRPAPAPVQHRPAAAPVDSRRFKKRWVAIPLALLMLIVTLVLVVAGLLLWAAIAATG